MSHHEFSPEMFPCGLREVQVVFFCHMMPCDRVTHNFLIRFQSIRNECGGTSKKSMSISLHTRACADLFAAWCSDAILGIHLMSLSSSVSRVYKRVGNVYIAYCRHTIAGKLFSILVCI